MGNIDPNYRATLVILNDIEKKGLYHFNAEYHDEKFFLNFIDFQKGFSNSFSEVIRKLDDFDTKREDVILFAVYSMLSFVNSHLKVFEKFLKIIIDPTKLKGGFDQNTTLSLILKKTCNKMQYNPKLKNAIRGLFLADFADALSTHQYLISKDGHLIIYPKDGEKKKQITIDELYDDSLQVRSIFNAMIDWADTTDMPPKNKTETIDDIVKNLINQVSSLDKKLDLIS
ncbi:hypothetical protein AAA799B03_01218 [Marine Group I thaumarchaeote SCGC AAA799-B03]|uniref:Uncharacterized protein n=3 Tax=Marine Group I TaxID=905826 RepID=A0A087S693_9ARCH|nr:hypothetical protein AAA799N04_00168 [Marine Group I thaumarchaeote SCGC AAA799-N04]KFM17672.1 hypothetical protein SCCGRSA3_01602 [Marine Group I thaumarchaeote SCGC RSA3]KFM21247.1 hypothetical protein AAA799B03_01218 [Marine Group I thaumarchaeote SCGC AAA799-B03]